MDPTKPVELFGPVSRISYAQNMEDILLDRLFRGRPGTFMDVGANHPFVDSNTYFFYVRGWRGVNLEPSSRGHALFLEHRPDDRNLAVAASDHEGSMTFYEVSGADGLTGLSTLEADGIESARAKGFTVAETTVPVRTVASLIDEHRIEPPDLMSIDVEGHEAAVIRSIPLATWRPKVLVVESTVPLSNVSTHEEWEPVLLEHGYLFAAFNGVNRFYLRHDLAEHLPLFATPVSALDHYQRQEVIALSHKADGYRDRYEQERSVREHDRALYDRERAGWEWAKAQAQYIGALWEQDSARFAAEHQAWQQRFAEFDHQRTEWERERAEWDRERAEMARERAAWASERAHHEHVLSEAQHALRPYRLVDRFGVVGAGYGLARKITRRPAS